MDKPTEEVLKKTSKKRVQYKTYYNLLKDNKQKIDDEIWDLLTEHKKRYVIENYPEIVPDFIDVLKCKKKVYKSYLKMEHPFNEQVWSQIKDKNKIYIKKKYPHLVPNSDVLIKEKILKKINK